MIDMHCHILPGVDDGSSDLQDSVEMARLAAESGVVGIVATPHCAGDGADMMRKSFSLLREVIKDEKIPVELFLGMEIFGTWATAELLKEGRLFTLNGSDYPLIEFDFHADGNECVRILREVSREGYRPVVAHPERYDFIARDPGLIKTMCDMGCLLQINRGSLLGRFGKKAQSLAFMLVERDLAAMVASDAHSSAVRTTWMRDVKELLEREFSAETAEKLLVANPLSILKNEKLVYEPKWFK
ncbi:MAG: hypothetical protein IJ017_00690 [Oscillospiraceae bacterium]|nr:hypothetical protein [Oscillospiraceae bacterium]